MCKKALNLSLSLLLSGVACVAVAQERTLKDFGKLEQDIEYETKLKTLHDLRQKNTVVPMAVAPAGAAVPGTPAAPAPVVVPAQPKVPKVARPEGVHLRGVVGVNNKLRGIFLKANGAFEQCPVGCSIDGWTVADIQPAGYAKLVRGKDTFVLPMDPPQAPRVVQTQPAGPAESGNRVAASPLPSPRLNDSGVPQAPRPAGAPAPVIAPAGPTAIAQR